MSQETKQNKSMWEEECELHCSAEWHLAKLKTGLAGIVCTDAIEVSRKSQNYSYRLESCEPAVRT
jgi:hypothetical protein